MTRGYVAREQERLVRSPYDAAMKALVYREYGTPDVLHLEDVPTPEFRAGEVLVRVHASSVNDYDYHLLTGRPVINRIGGVRRPKHMVLGSDVAGVVEAVGAGVTRHQPGDRVFGDMSPFGFGAFAEFACAPEAAFARMPAALSFEQAAAVPQAGSLAMAGLRQRLPIEPGQAILVNGAGGGVGTFAMQIAKTYKADVTGVDSARKLAAVQAAGADHLVDYRDVDFTRTGRRYDLIIDVASHRSLAEYRRCLEPGGVCSLIGGSIPRLLMVLALGGVLSAGRNSDVRVPHWKPNDPAETAALTTMLENGTVAPIIDSVVPLDGVPDAFRRFGAQEHTGKIAITLGS
jgi:NADPH:quinone reductase-like Zn-dependent oxidoreductase